MTPKEKAKELIRKIKDNLFEQRAVNITDEDAIVCALLVVDEVLKSEPRYPSDVDWDDVGGTHQYYYEAQRAEALNYWQQVKQEIINY